MIFYLFYIFQQFDLAESENVGYISIPAPKMRTSIVKKWAFSVFLILSVYNHEILGLRGQALKIHPNNWSSDDDLLRSR